MTAKVLDGKATAAAIKEELRGRVAALAERGHTPGLGTLLVGEDAGSQKYVAGKHRDAPRWASSPSSVSCPRTRRRSRSSTSCAS